MATSIEMNASKIDPATRPSATRIQIPSTGAVHRTEIAEIFAIAEVDAPEDAAAVSKVGWLVTRDE